MESITLYNLARMLLRASGRVIENKDKIDAINVFPVADSDTGSNLASTFSGIEKLLKRCKADSMTGFEFADEIIKSAFEKSRGNSGMMMASYLKGFLSPLKGKNKFFLSDLIHASKNGRDSARDSIEKPVSGTILDVMNAFCFSLESKSKNDGLLFDVFYKATQDTKIALLATKKKLKVLEENHVVDAGALGFTFFVYGFYEGLSNVSLKLASASFLPQKKIPSPLRNDKNTIGKFPHEVIFSIQNSVFKVDQIRAMLSPMGDCLDIIEMKERVKIHIHTDKPDAVEETAHLTGNVVDIKIMDIRLEKRLNHES